jgi:hypothetical protein
VKVIIAGSRSGPVNINNPHAQSFAHAAVLLSGFEVTEIVSGCCSGVDVVGESLCTRLPNKPNVKRFPADWKQHGKAAGPIRNKQMAEYADALVVIWDGTSRGSRSMIECAADAEIPIFQVIVR